MGLLKNLFEIFLPAEAKTQSRPAYSENDVAVTALQSQKTWNEAYKENTEILKGEKWSAALDGKTCIVCAGRDGKIFPNGEGPTIPAHAGCRCARIAIVNPKFAIPGMKMERASMNGPVNAKTTYGSWLKKQPTAFQNDVLGIERGRLFRSGKVPLDKFVDDQGEIIPIEELKKMIKKK
ncbi:MAG: hypothetical protein FP810_18110 [Desulfocapsa sp.]|nr:hypothetical protein [Desulfocapsa sp.]MBU4028282.1 phage head morphogenesis protein [Pseudomonadota bacterium]MBU4167731.1 phage head morphogenesis protein [Pseudomonadota bacterium]